LGEYSIRSNFKVPFSYYVRKELEVKDKEKRLVFHVDSTLSPEKRQRLQTAVMAWCNAVKKNISGAELKDQNTSELNRPVFSTFHFSYYSKYGQSVSVFTIPSFFYSLTFNRVRVLLRMFIL
jgi:hypothetical protein